MEDASDRVTEDAKEMINVSKRVLSVVEGAERIVDTAEEMANIPEGTEPIITDDVGSKPIYSIVQYRS